MSAEKQLEAAQRFLRGIRSPASYAEARDKQAAGLLRALERIPVFTASAAAAWLGALQEDLWSSCQVQRFTEVVAAKTKPVETDTSRVTAQDFTLLPYYLTDDLAQAIGNPAVDSDQLLYRLCQHAVKLSLRNASEASKATILVLAKWVTCKNGLVPKQQFDLFCRYKPVVTKYLTGMPDSKCLLDLPLSWQELDQELRNRAFPTGKPADSLPVFREICEYVRHMPLRKDNRLLQNDTQAVPSSSAGSTGGGLAVDDICKVLEAASKLQQPHVDRALSSQSMASKASEEGKMLPMLAICDRPRVEPEAVLPKSEESRPAEVATLSVEEQIEALRGEMAASSEDFPRGMKRPAAAGACGKDPKPKGRPRANPKPKGRPRAQPQASVPEKEKKQAKGLKRPAAAASTKGRSDHAAARQESARKQRSGGSGMSPGDLSRAERRARVLKLVDMPPKDNRHAASEYSYVEDDEEEVAETDPPEDTPRHRSRTTGEEEARRSLRETATAGGAEEPSRSLREATTAAPEASASAPRPKSASAPMAKSAAMPAPTPELRAARVVSPGSSSDRGPRARRSPRSRGRSRSRHRRRRLRRAEEPRHETETRVPVPEPFPRLPMVPPPPPPKGKGKRQKQVCPHCWQKVGQAGGVSGLSQHQWWNELCLAWQIYGQHGEGCATWEEAQERARDLKEDRRREAIAEFGPENIVPARSSSHLRAEAERRREESEPARLPRESKGDKKTRRKEKRRRRRPSPSPDVRAGPKGPRRPPSSDDDERDTGEAKGHKASDTVWIRVPRSALLGR
eukprot:s5818_g2.t1